MISNFSELLSVANEQKEPQRLLLLLAKTESKKKKKKHHQKGTITPVMCVDKLPEDIKSFQSFVDEADQITKDWDVIIIAGLSGQNGQPPTTEEADPYLNQMTNALASGQDLSQYVIFDREEKPIIVQSN